MQLELSVDRIEEERVVLIDQDQNIFVWPKSVLPDVHEGQLVFLDISFNERDKDHRAPNVAAKDILNEILQIE